MSEIPAMGSSDGSVSVWRDAASYSARAHAGQTRKDGLTPYAAHPARVALTVATLFGCDDPEVLAIALLHDTIEDGTTDYEDLYERFGAVVADGVASLTKDAALPETERDRHAEARLRSGCWRAKLVKLADVIDNASDLPAGDAPGDTERRRRLAARSVWAIAAARSHESDDASITARLCEAAGITERFFAEQAGLR